MSKSNAVQSEERVSLLQEELNAALEASHKQQAENTRGKTERARLEAELENLQVRSR